YTINVLLQLFSITITHPATKLSYTVGDALVTTGLVVNGTFSDGSTSVVTPTSVTGFNSSAPVTGQVLTIHVGSHTTTYLINIVAASPAPINLGTASTFGVLGSSTVTTTTSGTVHTVITGDLGLYPGTSVTGFSSSSTLGTGSTALTSPFDALATISGTVNIANTIANNARNDATTAYTILQGATCTTNYVGSTDLGTLTLTPGVYCTPSGFSINSGQTLTLNGSGLYIFKAGSTLVTATDANVVLTGGATAGNVFWQVGSSATLANPSTGVKTFPGTVIAQASISVTGSLASPALLNVNGRLIALTGAVTFADGAHVMVPSVPDITNPTISVVSPLDGSVINQNHFAISGTAADNVLVHNVTVTVNGTLVPVTGTVTWSTDSGILTNGTYTIVATAFDTSGNSASKTIHVTVNTVVISTPGTSITSATGAGPIISVTDHGHFTSFTPLSESSLPTVGKPVGESFPYGFLSFNVAGLTNGQTIHVTQTYPAPIPANAKYWKVEGGVWTDATSLISISGNTLTLTITDGGFGDSDGVANGMITDPSGIGILPPINLGATDTFGILASTYTNTSPGTSITGDLGYTTGPAVNPVIFGTTHIADSTYSQAGTDEGSTLVALNALTCNFSFGSVTNLSLLSQPLVPGVYCIASAQSIGTAGITLNGAGTYVFRSTGALDTAVNSHVTLTGGANAFNVFWTPGAGTTLGANSVFAGTDIDDSGITVGSTVSVTGRLLAFGGTVSTDVDTISVPSAPVAPLQFQMASGSNSPSESRPSLGGVLLQTFNDGLRINGHVFDVSKFHNPVPQQVLPLDKQVSITVKQGLTRGSPFWQHAMLFMNFNGKDTTTGNADTWISIDKTDGVQVHDPNGFVTNVGIHNGFDAYRMNTTFTFTPVKQMSDSNMIIRVWDDKLSQTDAYVDGAIVFGDVPATVAPMVKPDWIQVFTTMSDADNVIENAGFVKPALFSHISTTNQVWTQPNTGHILWFYDTKDLQVARVIYDASGNVMGETVEPLINATSIMAKDMSYAGNHLNRQNDDAMKQALAQQASNAAQTIERLGYSR
ncbi:MAG: ice-binding family protein, partial [Nitrosotalea sp.]